MSVADWSMIESALAANGWAALRRDAVDMLAAFPANSVDMFGTDPAYESLEKHRAKGGPTGRLMHSDRSSNDWFPIFRDERFPELLKQMYRTLKRDRHAYIMCDDTTSDVIKPMARAAGFKIWSRLVADLGDEEAEALEGEPGCERLTWNKMSIGMGYHWRSQTEFILFLEKGKRKLNFLGWPNILPCKRVMTKGTYPTEKPPELFERLIANSTQPGELVVDPFCGSGPCGEAAGKLGRQWVGIDVGVEAMRRSRLRCGLVETRVA